ncbi:DUF550 domain-containing protein [Klebsiella pneumoniae]
MTNNQLTDERVTSVIERLEHYACNLKWTNVRGAQDLLAAADGLRELQERRNAERDSNPVGWTDEAELRDVEKDGCGYLFKANPITPHADPRRVILLYRHAQPASEREQVRQEHAEWSQATFGNVGPVGPLKHLSKEALEAAAEPGDLSEWADMQFLLWDAQRRAGITDEQITQAMIDKLAVNKQREWPEPKDGEPRLHIKEQPAPVAPVVPQDVLDALQKVARIRLDMNDFDGDLRGIADCLCDAEEALIEVVNRCAAMLAAAPQSPGSEPATVQGKWIPVSEQNPDCWCLTCRPVTLNDMRFVVCPDCGNKRCPRANDHRNACTGSNEPGQEGGAYPDTPQEVKP